MAPTQDFVPSTASAVQEQSKHKSGAAHPLDPLSPDEVRSEAGQTAAGVVVECCTSVDRSGLS
jgi:hypothetical protein